MDLIAVMLNLLALDPDGPFEQISFMIKRINMLDQVLLTFIKSSAQKTEIARELQIKAVVKAVVIYWFRFRTQDLSLDIK